MVSEIKKALLDKERVFKAKSRIGSNEEIAGYYSRKADESFDERYDRHALAMRLCLKFWDFDYYRMQAVKDVRRVNRCRDLFCRNCQHRLAEDRQSKYGPILSKLRDQYDIYHITFTVPNCTGVDLKETLDLMFLKFVYINQYMQGKRKCKDIDLIKFGYVGCIRSLEITTRITLSGVEYHPHFHCLFLMRKHLRFNKVNINKFSFDESGKRKALRYFSDFEILLQKMWFLFFNGEKVSKQALDNLSEGYSVAMNRCDSDRDFHEVFKYAIKGVTAKGNEFFSYEVFDILSDVLHRRKMTQGYGILNRMKFDDEELTDEEVETIYFGIIEELKRIEDPIFCTNSLSEVLSEFDDHPEITYISKSRIRSTYNEG